jgi:transposase
MSYKQSTLRSRLYAFYGENKEKGKSFVWHHFLAEGSARTTIYRLMGQIDKGLSLSRKKGSGRKPIFNTPKKRSQVARKFNHKKGLSLRKVAKSLNCSKSKIQNMLKMRKNPILCYKRTKRPDRTPIQRLVARPKCRHLYFNFREHQFIIDDESYFTLSNANLSGNDIFYSNTVKHG